MNLTLLHGLARISVEWLLYSLLEGGLLALLVWTLLRLLPRRNSGTRFAIWFSALLAIVALPAAGIFWRASSGAAADATISGAHAPISIPVFWALIIFSVWALFAALALSRVIYGLWQVRRLRQSSTLVDLETLHPMLREVVEKFRGSRRAALYVSSQVEVPAAIGFLRPAVLLPAWLMEELPPAELKQVLLHEFTHLQRRDDWTNLIQKFVRAVLFFHPAVWWLDQRISLEREMACDDAVLAQVSHPNVYAHCLARMAEKSLTRRRLSLAQAAVGRMRQLSLRVARILDAAQPRSLRLWKPAVPLVITAATLCAISARNVPMLVAVNDAPQTVASVPLPPLQAAPITRSPVVEAAWHPAEQNTQQAARVTRTSAHRPVRPAKPAIARGDYYVADQITVIVQNQQVFWQVRFVQVPIPPAAEPHVNKTTSRKTI